MWVFVGTATSLAMATVAILWYVQNRISWPAKDILTIFLCSFLFILGLVILEAISGIYRDKNENEEDDDDPPDEDEPDPPPDPIDTNKIPACMRCFENEKDTICV